MRHVALASTSALLLSFSGRLWGTPYIALFALVPAIYALTKTRSPWVAGLVSYITALPIVVVGFEGLIIETPSFFFIATFVLSLWFFLPGFVTAWLAKRRGTDSSLWLFVAIWVAAETIAGSYSLWGNWAYPLSLGSAFTVFPLLQLTYWSGTAILSAAILTINLSLFLLFWKKRVANALTLMLCIGALCFITQARLEPDSSSSDESMPIGVVQGTISELEFIAASFSALEQERLMERYSTLTERLMNDRPDVDLVVWAEGAAGYYFNYFGNDRKKIERTLPENVALFAGAYDGRLNSVFFWDTQSYNFVYHKQALVPFFESFLRKGEGYTDGLVALGGQRVGLGICWESLYPELSRRSVKMGADLLLYVSNDTFAGSSVTPWHHTRSGALRAVESGQYVVFASQSGPSAVFSPVGETIPLLDLGERGYAVADIPINKPSKITPYIRLGNWFGWGCVVVLTVLSFYSLASHKLEE